MAYYDFIVLGGGIAGVSVAAELSPHAKVLLIEREDAFGYHSTGRSAALLMETYGPPVVRALTRASRAFFVEHDPAFSPAALSRPRGALWVAGVGAEASLSALTETFDDQLGHSIDPDACKSLAAILKTDQICGGYSEPGALDLDVDALHQGYMRRGRALGAVFAKGMTAPVLTRSRDRWRVDQDGDTCEAPVIINATGAWADETAQALGASPQGLQPLRRTAVLVDPPPGQLIADWPTVMDADGLYYFKPEGQALLLSPADETASPAADIHPDEMDVAVAIDRVQQVADLPVRRVNHAWAGLRTFSPDGLPVIGYDPVAPGVFWLAGQGGFGIQTAPALGRLAAALALRDKTPADLADAGRGAALFSPARRLNAGIF